MSFDYPPKYGPPSNSLHEAMRTDANDNCGSLPGHCRGIIDLPSQGSGCRMVPLKNQP